MRFSGRQQLRTQDLRQLREVVGVEPRVLQLRLRQRTLAPIAALVLLVEPHGEVCLQHRRQPDGRLAKGHRRNLGVEEARELERIDPFEGLNVVLGVVEHLDDRRVREDGGERREVERHEGIDQEVTLARADLDEAHPLAVREQRIRLGVDRDHALLREARGDLAQGILGLDVHRGVQRSIRARHARAG